MTKLLFYLLKKLAKLDVFLLSKQSYKMKSDELAIKLNNFTNFWIHSKFWKKFEM